MRTSKASSPYERTKWVSKYFNFLYIPFEFWSKIHRLEAVTNEQYAIQSLEKPIQTSA